MAQKMEDLAKVQPGYLGIESARDAQGFGITVSYWDNPESIMLWRKNVEHQAAQAIGRSTWYQEFKVRVTKVERDY